MRVSASCSSNRQSSTRSAFSLKIAKFVPLPSQVGPSGNGLPGQTSISVLQLHGRIREVASELDGPAAKAQPLRVVVGLDHLELARQLSAQLEEPRVQRVGGTALRELR